LPVLSIIACKMLEDELTRVLSLDATLRHLILVDNLDGMGLSRKLRAQNRSHLLVDREEIPDRIKDLQKDDFGKFMKPLLKGFHIIRGRAPENASEQEHIVVVNVLRMALHSDGKLIKMRYTKTSGRCPDSPTESCSYTDCVEIRSEILAMI